MPYSTPSSELEGIPKQFVETWQLNIKKYTTALQLMGFKLAYFGNQNIWDPFFSLVYYRSSTAKLYSQVFDSTGVDSLCWTAPDTVPF